MEKPENEYDKTKLSQFIQQLKSFYLSMIHYEFFSQLLRTLLTKMGR